MEQPLITTSKRPLSADEERKILISIIIQLLRTRCDRKEALLLLADLQDQKHLRLRIGSNIAGTIKAWLEEVNLIQPVV